MSDASRDDATAPIPDAAPAVPPRQPPPAPWIKTTLAGAITALLAIALFMSFIAHDDANRNLIIGAIIGQFVAMIQYYFGSSESSRGKDDIIARVATGDPPPKAP